MVGRQMTEIYDGSTKTGKCERKRIIAGKLGGASEKTEDGTRTTG
jgi:hypothetical protein